MSLAAFAVEKKALTFFITFVLFVGGVAAFNALGQLEDPEFTVKTAVISTTYHGASPTEVELEVSDRIEVAVQELRQLKWVESVNWPGVSQVKVEILPQYWDDELPQVWDELRRKVRDMEGQLPPGAGKPLVVDDYGAVFGFQLAVVGDGFDYAELERYAKDLRKELVLVKGVARVDLVAIQDKILYLDVSETQLSQLGLSDESIEQTLQNQNMVVDAGGVDLQELRYRIAPTGQFSSPEDIANLAIRPTLFDSLQQRSRGDGRLASSELIRIGDIGDVRRGFREPPSYVMRYNGFPAVGLSMTHAFGSNIVEVGRNIDARLAELIPNLPVGIEVRRVNWQSDAVSDAIDNFLVSFAEAVGIVLVVLAVFMGWRMGVIIGTALIATVLGTFIIMALLEIDLHRMSLGALVISLGMMVDNAIVVADGMMVRLQKGMDRTQAAIEAGSQPSVPLIGATVVAVMAFFPIYASPESTGEYCKSLFEVVAIALLFSWVVSVTLTPLQCIYMVPDPKSGESDPYASGLFQRFRRLLERAIRQRWLTLGSMAALLVVAIVGFGGVRQVFFPASSMAKFMVDVWMPQGTRVERVAANISRIEQKLMEDERVESVTSYIGGGPPRFYLPVTPEDRNTSYGHFIVAVRDFGETEEIFNDISPWLNENLPDALVPLRKFSVGPGKTWEFELRLSGPAVADPDVLRGIAEKAVDIITASPAATYARQDWRNRVQKVVPIYNQEQGRWATVTREDLAGTTKRAFDGRQVGLYREGDDLIPILLRHVEDERENVGGIEGLQIKPALTTEPVPLAQVTEDVVAEWEDPVINRRDRRRTVKIQSNPALGSVLAELRDDVEDKLFALGLPPGYRLEWGGITEDERDSQAALIPGIIPAVAIVVTILIALFNAYRPPLVILLTIPLAIIGITAGLLGTNTAFGFMALLGAMSLAGMMIKNAIVLLDEVNINLANGLSPYKSVREAAVSRLRPVMLAAATTVLGVIPLLQDVFWVSMAVTIMAGLTFGTVLTMVVVPVLYATLYRIKVEDSAKA
ncbi:MAG: efflux RND transporter permease subunit [Acidiferrobacterales bacterium]